MDDVNELLESRALLVRVLDAPGTEDFYGLLFGDNAASEPWSVVAAAMANHAKDAAEYKEWRAKLHGQLDDLLCWNLWESDRTDTDELCAEVFPDGEELPDSVDFPDALNGAGAFLTPEFLNNETKNGIAVLIRCLNRATDRTGGGPEANEQSLTYFTAQYAWRALELAKLDEGFLTEFHRRVATRVQARIVNVLGNDRPDPTDR